MSKQPKFKVGEVVYFDDHSSFVKVTMRYEVAGGSLRLLWNYNVFWGFGYVKQGVDERNLRRLTKRERGGR